MPHITWTQDGPGGIRYHCTIGQASDGRWCGHIDAVIPSPDVHHHVRVYEIDAATEMDAHARAQEYLRVPKRRGTL